jgi:hypothetical protein
MPRTGVSCSIGERGEPGACIRGRSGAEAPAKKSAKVLISLVRRVLDTDVMVSAFRGKASPSRRLLVAV